MKKISLVIFAAILTFPTFAEEFTSPTQFPRGLQLGVGISATSGLNGFIGYANKDFESFWWKRFGLRFDFASTTPISSIVNSAVDSALDRSIDIGRHITIDGHSGVLHAHHIGLLLDFYPFGNTWFLGGWRLTGGYMNGELDLVANLIGRANGLPPDAWDFQFGNNIFRYNGNSIRGKGDVNWKYSGPYLGTGFDLGLFRGFKIYMDAGVVFTSRTAELRLFAPVNDVLQISFDNGATWINIIEQTPLIDLFLTEKAMVVQDANEELEKYKLFPMVKLGLMYRF
ncbi:MAG: hypothetical protein FWE50_02710 [Alphaproteobacteria bacterium]|nr:hypothetical protein [Alphaproteobacteria bacterium]